MDKADYLRTAFADREELTGYLQATFPAVFERSPQVSTTRGGRKAADALLQKLEPVRYQATRNSLNGAVTRLSPYLRHGIVGLGEVSQRAFELAGRSADKLINELGWRDYFQRVYARIGDGIWRDQEEYKTGWKPGDYARELPPDLVEGRSGLNCMDSFVTDLYETGYLHNHARLWLAAYLVHWRRVRWDAGAHWFLRHLLDGDPASNNLSWQWVASTFASKPYLFNRRNLENFAGPKYCQACPLARRGCPFDYSTEELQTQLFPNLPPQPENNQGAKNNNFKERSRR